MTRQEQGGKRECSWCHTMVEEPCTTIVECRGCPEPYTLNAEQAKRVEEIVARRNSGRRTDFHIEVGDDAFLTVDEIWPDGDAPENPTTEDVIAQIKRTSHQFSFASDWGFDSHVQVDGKPVW